MPFKEFSPPAYLTDFDDIPHQREAWTEIVGFFFDSAIQSIEEWDKPPLGKGNSQFYNPLKQEAPSALAEAEIVWRGYPRRFTIQYGEEPGLQQAEDLHPITDFIPSPTPPKPKDPCQETIKSYNALKALSCRAQDEYCEWHVTRDQDNAKILRVTFTSEGPEYWGALAQGYPSDCFYYSNNNPDVTAKIGPKVAKAHGSKEKLLSLYHQYVGEQVKEEDLFFPETIEGYFNKGDYNPFNKWNTQKGIMHLTHPANTLMAEIQLAADGSVLRTSNGKLVQEADQLICCANYGDPNRSSDPNIGNGINQLARPGMLISIKDPIALYMDGLDLTGWTEPDGTTPLDERYWRIERGRRGMILRAVFEVPPEKAGRFTVSDLMIGGQPLKYAGQIAQRIRMKLTGVAFLPEKPKPRQYIACGSRCCRNLCNPSELKIVGKNSPCPPLHDPVFPGIPIPWREAAALPPPESVQDTTSKRKRGRRCGF